MTEEQVTIKVTADTSEYSAGMREAQASNKEFQAQTQRMATDVKKGWSQATGSISEGAKGIGKSLKGTKIAEGFKGLAGKGVIGALTLGIKGIVAGVVVASIKTAVEAMRKSTALFDTGLAEKQANRINSAFLRLKTTIGAIISPLYTIATEILTRIADGFNHILETVLNVTGFIMGLVGAMGALSRTATDYADGMEEATAAASAGLAGFDKLTTIDTSGMGDEAQAQRIRDMMADAAESGNALRDSIAVTLNPLNLIGNFFANIGLERQWEGFTQSAIESWTKVSELGGEVWSGITDIASDSWNKYVDTATVAWNAISRVGTRVWSSLSDSLGQMARRWFDPVLEGATNLSRIIGSAMDGLLTFDMTATWNNISNGFISTWNNISNGFISTWNNISNGFISTWNGVIAYAGESFEGAFVTIAGNVQTVFAGISGGVSGLVDSIVTGLSQIPDRMSSIFSSVWQAMTGGFKTVANGIIGMFNKVIGAYNNTIGRMNVDVFGNTIGFSAIGEIPMLAQGGIAEPNDPFLAVLGDNRKEREFITPESTMRDVVRSVIEEQGGVRQTIEIPISLDGRVIARATYDYYSRESKRRGTSWL